MLCLCNPEDAPIGSDACGAPFANRYFTFDLEKVVHDAGPFDKNTKDIPRKYKMLMDTLPSVLPQNGLAVLLDTPLSALHTFYLC